MGLHPHLVHQFLFIYFFIWSIVLFKSESLLYKISRNFVVQLDSHILINVLLAKDWCKYVMQKLTWVCMTCDLVAVYWSNPLFSCEENHIFNSILWSEIPANIFNVTNLTSQGLKFNFDSDWSPFWPYKDTSCSLYKLESKSKEIALSHGINEKQI